MVTYWLIILGIPQVSIKLIKLLLDHILTQNINILLINFLKYIYFCSIRLKYYQTNKQVKSFSAVSRAVNTTETWRVILFTLNEMNPLLETGILRMKDSVFFISSCSSHVFLLHLRESNTLRITFQSSNI